MSYKTLVGLEIHVELMTERKMFCNCKNEFGSMPNTNVCPVCLGLPGALPVMDKQAVKYAIMAGIAFNCEIDNTIIMDRKSYFYPDLTKGYQISQSDFPLCKGGFLEITLKEGTKKIRLERIHIEEDTGKQIHTDHGTTLLDFNRSGVPLIEIVTKPDINSAEEARLFLEKLKNTIKYIGISDVKMEEGSLRCDVNINVVDEDKGIKSNISEIKNLNSFKSVVKAIEYEQERHIALLESGKNTDKETRRFNELTGETILMRKKFQASDYRYQFEADLSKIKLSDDWIKEIESTMPELPDQKKKRFIEQYNITEYDASVLTQSKELSFFFEELVSLIEDSKLAANWVMTDVMRRLNEEDKEIAKLNLSAQSLAELLNYVKSGKINNNTAKKVLREMLETNKTASFIIEKNGLIQISDEDELEKIIDEVIKENQQSIEDFKNGKDRALGFLMGQIMKKTKGKANPNTANKILIDKINGN
ncbi:Asp-tRNA(Asn)/Glu-tRNA(Gln) amidotransferase subunit GatB [Soehngenia longivitae]|uniref:Aspartyl/glutamyl-tRNA(Asn/Gln) amidotransferase subunit B n=1 Tax=Soehngenia longivitae TaxID=2562294 RepID=A0A4Z0DAE6_9FIRM|nr:Asp-tRNA(Asn)/Glu-tRNA(Gln) amidotransferase subunit GatB [Soehngenia longivitae]TFZ41775.1 Asp-tRNA(Asn)/Glu-tRNA(Gln) amidotransferase subunit GatB [Soehngenia longivitae]